jgi:hypothetical protein
MYKLFKKFKFCEKIGDAVKKETKDFTKITINDGDNFFKNSKISENSEILDTKESNNLQISKIAENLEQINTLQTTTGIEKIDEKKIPEKLKRFFGNSEESNLIEKKVLEDVIKYKVMEDSISPTVEKLKNEVPEIAEHIKFREHIKSLINDDKQEEALRKEGLVILRNKLDPFFKYEIDTHHYRKFHDRHYEVDIKEVLTKDLYAKQRVVDEYVEENKKKLNDLIGYYNNQFKYTKYNKYSYLIYQNNYLNTMKKLKISLLKNITSVSALSFIFYALNPYLMLVLLPEYISIAYSFYLMNGLVDQVILLDSKQHVKFRTFNFLGFRREYPKMSLSIMKLFYDGKVKNDVLNLNDKGFFFTTRLLRRYIFGHKNKNSEDIKTDDKSKNKKTSQSDIDNFKYFHKIRVMGKSYFIPADSSSQHPDTNEELILNMINNNLKFICEYDYSSYEDRADALFKMVEDYKKEIAKRNSLSYETEEERLQKEYSDFVPNRDFTDSKYELTLKRPDDIDGTYINNGYR